MKILQVPILYCYRCKITFAPRIDPVAQLVIIPKACPNRNCRNQTWNIPDTELEIIRKTQNHNLLLGPGSGMKKNVPVLDKYKPKKSEPKPLILCVECEIFYYDKDALKRHQMRRHHGMCMTCHASNVYVVMMHGTTICKSCLESKKA